MKSWRGLILDLSYPKRYCSTQSVFCQWLIVLAVSLGITQELLAQDWLRFRGPNGSGIANDSTKLPTEFDDEKNVIWKVELPGCGASSPIVVGEHVIVTCYSGYGAAGSLVKTQTQKQKQIGEMKNLLRHVCCFRKRNGELLWRKDFDPHLPEDPFTGVGVPQHGYASSTPVSDGQRVFAFLGKSGVVALDLNGRILWKKKCRHRFRKKSLGVGSKPDRF